MSTNGEESVAAVGVQGKEASNTRCREAEEDRRRFLWSKNTPRAKEGKQGRKAGFLIFLISFFPLLVAEERVCKIIKRHF